MVVGGLTHPEEAYNQACRNGPNLDDRLKFTTAARVTNVPSRLSEHLSESARKYRHAESFVCDTVGRFGGLVGSAVLGGLTSLGGISADRQRRRSPHRRDELKGIGFFCTSSEGTSSGTLLAFRDTTLCY